MMKTLLSIGLSTVVLFAMMPAAMAETASKKEIRNDRVSVSKQIAQYDINPFADTKRMMRNDRVSYSFPELKETTQEKKTRIMRNDRVTVNR